MEMDSFSSLTNMGVKRREEERRKETRGREER
jgi:hypothetical protein